MPGMRRARRTLPRQLAHALLEDAMERVQQHEETCPADTIPHRRQEAAEAAEGSEVRAMSTVDDLLIPAEYLLTELDYCDGYLVKTTDTVRVEVWRMLVNWRIVTTPVDAPGWPVRGWCYRGTGPQTFAAAIIAAYAWDGSDDTEPPGYFKRAGDDYDPPVS